MSAAGEAKTKPTQHSVKELLSNGIQPGILLCRTQFPLSVEARKKIALFCNIREPNVINAPDVDNIYRVPIRYHEEGLDRQVLAHFNMPVGKIDLSRWTNILERIDNPDGEVNISIVGKYVTLKDSYKSLIEALAHGGIANRVRVNLDWVDSEKLEHSNDAEIAEALRRAHGVLVPGGFGIRGIEGKIAAATFARTRKVPYFGICFGMQMAVVESARNVMGLAKASSTEFGPCDDPVICLMTEWQRGNAVERRKMGENMGGTMRLGAYEAKLAKGSKVHEVYGSEVISERHRHRYEVNIDYKDRLEQNGLWFSGLSPDGLLPEIVELRDHPWFIGVQFHPELKSKPFEPHPLFTSFIGAAVEQSRLV
jgi:CTP synthase